MKTKKAYQTSAAVKEAWGGGTRHCEDEDRQSKEEQFSGQELHFILCSWTEGNRIPAVNEVAILTQQKRARD